MGRDSSVGTATRYGLDGPRIECQLGGEIFLTRPDLPWGPRSLLYNGPRVSFLRVKRPGRGVDHPPDLSPRLKKEWSCTCSPPLGLHGLLRANFTFTFSLCTERAVIAKVNVEIDMLILAQGLQFVVLLFAVYVCYRQRSCPYARHEGVWGSRGIVHPFLTSALNGCKWPTSHSGRFNLVERLPPPTLYPAAGPPLWAVWR